MEKRKTVSVKNGVKLLEIFDDVKGQVIGYIVVPGGSGIKSLEEAAQEFEALAEIGVPRSPKKVSGWEP